MRSLETSWQGDTTCCEENGRGGSGWLVPFTPYFPTGLAQRWRPQGWERAGLGSVPASEAPDPGPSHILGAPRGWRKASGSAEAGPQAFWTPAPAPASEAEPSSVPPTERPARQGLGATSTCTSPCHRDPPAPGPASAPPPLPAPGMLPRLFFYPQEASRFLTTSSPRNLLFSLYEFDFHSGLPIVNNLFPTGWINNWEIGFRKQHCDLCRW